MVMKNYKVITTLARDGVRGVHIDGKFRKFGEKFAGKENTELRNLKRCEHIKEIKSKAKKCTK